MVRAGGRSRIVKSLARIFHGRKCDANQVAIRMNRDLAIQRIAQFQVENDLSVRTRAHSIRRRYQRLNEPGRCLSTLKAIVAWVTDRNQCVSSHHGHGRRIAEQIKTGCLLDPASNDPDGLRCSLILEPADHEVIPGFAEEEGESASILGSCLQMRTSSQFA
jgi:hypothetical protein